MDKNEFFLIRIFREQISMNPFLLIADGKCADLQTLIRNNPNVLKSKKPRGSYSVNLLWEAMHLERHEIADMLLTAGLKPEGYANRPDINSIAQKGDLEMFELFTTKHGISFLGGEKSYNHEEKFVTAGCGCGEICEHKELIFKQLVINPILCDAISGGNKIIISKVLPHVDIENENVNGQTALHTACRKCDIDLVKFLLQNHANANHVTTNPKPYANLKHYALTPINYAITLCKENSQYEPEIAKKYLDIINCLLSAGGELKLTLSDIFDMELELFALLYKHFPESIRSDQLMSLRYLLCENNIPAIRSTLGRDMYSIFFNENCYTLYTTVPPLHPTSIIIRKEYVDLLSYLLEFFKDQLTGKDYEILVIKSAAYNNEHILRFVYNKTPLSRRNHLKTAFYFAIKNKNLRIVKFLIEKGNEIDANVFSIAWNFGNYEIIKLLITTGYDVNKNTDLLYQYYGRKNESDKFIQSVQLILDSGYNINHRSYSGKHIIEELVDFSYTTFVKCRLLCLLLNYPNLNYDVELVNNHLKEVFDKHDSGEYGKYREMKSECPADDMNIESVEALNIYVPILRSIMNNKIECCICFHNNEKFPIPCGHPVLCEECAPQISKCPQCTREISGNSE